MTGPASRFEHFEILRDEKGELMKLGLGGMGATYRAFDLHLRKHVALKIISERTFSEPNARRRFFNEARAAASIDHPNVARVIFLCPEDAVQCSFAMELVEGETLARRIAQHGPMNAADALLTLRPIADALIALGSRALIHRDIKPENIMTMRGEDGRVEVKLIDFGLAKTTAGQSNLLESVDTGERFVGSAYFASPEQINPIPGGLDCRSDFYSLGTTLWYCVTGAPPFTGTFFEVQESHIYKDPPWDKVENQPSALLVLLRQLLAKDPSARPPNARSLVAAWDQALATLDAAAPRSGPSASVLETSTIAGAPSPFFREGPAPFVLPEGAVPPPPSGTLITAPDGHTARFVRRIPPTLAPELLAGLKRAAQTARDTEHPGLLTIVESEPTSIAMAWPITVTAAQVAVWYGSALPPEIVLAWLPRLAATIDAAHARGLMHLGLQPDRVLVEYDAPAAPRGSAPDLGYWQAARLWLDPLAAFDAALVATARHIDSGGLNKRAPACSTVREYIAALARCIRDLMGGKTDGRALPIAAFDEARNHLIVEAISYRVNARSCTEWAQHLVGGVAPARVIPAALPQPVRETIASPTPRTSPAPAPSAPTPAHGVTPPARSRRPFPLPRPALYGGAGVLALALLFGLWQLLPRRSEPPPAAPAPTLQALMAEGEAAVTRGDFLRAQSVIAELARLDPQLPWLQTFRPRAEALRAAATSPSPTPRETVPPEFRTTLQPPTPAPASTQDPRAATQRQPFVNALGMAFVPVRIIGGASHGEIVLFSVYETRVRDFEPLADPARWQRLPRQKDEEPAVNVLPAEALAFADQLTRRDRLPTGWFYRLPTDHEWSCAAGIGERENPAQSASAKSDAIPDVYPWGRAWPPPAKAGNFADKALGGNFTMIEGYSDGYGQLAPVAQFEPHASGLFDLAGNAAEWCVDENAPKLRHLTRGGSFLTFASRELLSSDRMRYAEETRARDRGFRLVLTKARLNAPRGSDVKPLNHRGGATILRPAR